MSESLSYYQILLSTAYLAPIQYYAKLLSDHTIFIEKHEHFVKQTYRNRCSIYGANGKLDLIIPIEGRKDKMVIKDVKVDYHQPWQKLHWRSLESSYRRSPFFEFYEDDLKPFFDDKKYTYLIDLNEALQNNILSLLKIKTRPSYTESYQKLPESTLDLRNTISPKVDLNADSSFVSKRYMQTFETKNGFIPNLSIVDLLFNVGPQAMEYLISDRN